MPCLPVIDVPPRCFLEVTGTRGRVRVMQMFEESDAVHPARDGKDAVRNFSAPDRFKAQIGHFADWVLIGNPLEFPPEDALQNVALIEALKSAAVNGRTVAVPNRAHAVPLVSARYLAPSRSSGEVPGAGGIQAPGMLAASTVRSRRVHAFACSRRSIRCRALVGSTGRSCHPGCPADGR